VSSKRFRFLLFSVLVVVFLSRPAPGAEVRTRAQIPAGEKWDLSTIYPSEELWAKAKQELVNRIGGADAYKGRLGGSAKTLKDCLDFISDWTKELNRVQTYASLLANLDLGDAHAVEMRESVVPIDAAFQAKTAWVNPEILQVPAKKIESFYKQEKGLEIYRPVIDNILRMKPHTLAPAEEKILADAGLATGTPYSVFGIFSNADEPRASVTLSTGETVRLDPAGYTHYRTLPDRWDREAVFQAFFGNLREFRGTYGSLLNGEANKDLFLARARGYEDCLSSALDPSDIPTSVYQNLIRNTNKNLPTLWRYLKLRKRIMGLDQLRYSDIYPSIVKGVNKSYSVEEARDLILKSMAPLGEDYVKGLAEGLEKRWVDWLPTPGKRSGAFTNGDVYDVHPYVMLNFTGTYESLTTLAHEMGHAMHSYYSNLKQPYPTSQYTIFVAEVASTCNEYLLNDYLLKHTDDDAMKLFLWGNYIETLRGTLFRQAQFAEFELKFHRMVESGQALTGDNLTDAYAQILNKYYGVDQGIISINPVCYVEWAYIPHFFYNYYVYTYATSITASAAISQMILEKKPGAVENYRRFLTLGDSLPPIEELKIAGVDMTTDAPFDLTMKAMNRAMDEMESILDRMEKAKRQ
jgi:oligoendopeptidase F